MRHNSCKNHNELTKLLLNAAGDKYQLWQVWADFIYISATALSQPLNYIQEREDNFLHRVKSYDKNIADMFPDMFVTLVNMMERENSVGFSDILGDAYMILELGNHWKGQFFTPYNVCKMMAKISLGENNEDAVKTQGYITVNDPCCGGGGLLIATAEVLREDAKINFQKDVLYIGQDIDPVCALMCYIQLSLLGLPAIVYIGDTITMKYHDVWYTPIYMMCSWRYRYRKFARELMKGGYSTTEDSEVIVPPPVHNGGVIVPPPVHNSGVIQLSLFDVAETGAA